MVYCEKNVQSWYPRTAEEAFQAQLREGAHGPPDGPVGAGHSACPQATASQGPLTRGFVFSSQSSSFLSLFFFFPLLYFFLPR